MSDAEQYAAYFTQGQKITVCIPMDNNELFRDWAIVEELEEDVITLQLSRDELPVSVHLVAGSKLDLRIGKEGEGFRCIGYFVAGGGTGEIQVHLAGDVTTSELREFYRIDTFIPYRYNFSKEQNLDVLIGQWRKRKKIRLADEADRREAFFEKLRERLLRTATGEFEAEGPRHLAGKQPDIEEFYPIDETWDNVNASAINLSAGGFKFVTIDHFEIGELVFFEVFIPATPPRIMDSVARVVFRNNNYSYKDDKEHFNVAIQFVLIDDRDRDAIVSRISHLELLRIRQMRQLSKLDFQGVTERISPLKMVILIVLLLVPLFFIYYYLYEYSEQKVNNQIEETFQDAVRKYREKSGLKW